MLLCIWTVVMSCYNGKFTEVEERESTNPVIMKWKTYIVCEEDGELTRHKIWRKVFRKSIKLKAEHQLGYLSKWKCCTSYALILQLLTSDNFSLLKRWIWMSAYDANHWILNTNRGMKVEGNLYIWQGGKIYQSFFYIYAVISWSERVMKKRPARELSVS